jgi:adenylate cyclase
VTALRWPTLRVQQRIVVFFVVLLVAVELVSFYFIRYSIEQSAQNTLRQELQLAARVFKRLLDQNSQQLVEATSVLTYDFGFREAIGTRDRDTILSALRNHAARIKASGMAVIGLDGRVVADTLNPGTVGEPYPYADLVARAAADGRAKGIRMVDGRPYQVVFVPVLAPLPIAWVSMSFMIDNTSALDLKLLATSDVTFLELTAGGARLLASTVPEAKRDALIEAVPRMVASGTESMRLTLDGEDFEVLAAKLDDPGPTRMVAILQRSVAEGLAPFRELQLILLVIAAASLLVTVIVAMRLARRITQPLTRLVAAAGEIARGNYAVRVDANQVAKDEIGELARAFEGMTRGLVERDNMRDVLGKVASNAVAEQLLTGGIELGGEEREVTVMFTDVRNFTAICETLPPQSTLLLLNEFLTIVSEVVEKRHGVVDKYIGDGAMAIFGAPISRPDDAQNAVAAALEIRDRMAALGPSLAARDLPHPEIGIGINTARVLAGNIGSPSRLNYTVLGDGVNLASRFEGLTKRYRVPIVVGDLTQRSIENVVFRELDKVRVRGKTVPVRIFEPMAAATAGSRTRAGGILDSWHAALLDFRERRFDRARAIFERLEFEPGYQRLAEIYLGYLKELELRPPGPEWDGAFTLYEK